MFSCRATAISFVSQARERGSSPDTLLEEMMNSLQCGIAKSGGECFSARSLAVKMRIFPFCSSIKLMRGGGSPDQLEDEEGRWMLNGEMEYCRGLCVVLHRGIVG